MKGIFLLIFFTLVMGALKAQVPEQDSTQILSDTLIHSEEKADPILKEPIPWSIYIEFLPEYAPQPDQYGMHYQFGAGASYRWVSLGAFVNFQKQDIKKQLIFPNDFNLIHLHGGGFLGGRVVDYQRLAIDLRYNYSMGGMVWENSETKRDLVRENFSMSKPELILQYHLLNYVSVFTAAGYKIGHGITLPGVEKNDFNGFSLGVGIRVGFFRLVL